MCCIVQLVPSSGSELGVFGDLLTLLFGPLRVSRHAGKQAHDNGHENYFYRAHKVRTEKTEEHKEADGTNCDKWTKANMPGFLSCLVTTFEGLAEHQKSEDVTFGRMLSCTLSTGALCCCMEISLPSNSIYFTIALTVTIYIVLLL